MAAQCLCVVMRMATSFATQSAPWRCFKRSRKVIVFFPSWDSCYFTSHVDDQQLYQAGGDVSLHIFHDGKIGPFHPPTCLLFDKSRPLIWI